MEINRNVIAGLLYGSFFFGIHPMLSIFLSLYKPALLLVMLPFDTKTYALSIIFWTALRALPMVLPDQNVVLQSLINDLSVDNKAIGMLKTMSIDPTKNTGTVMLLAALMMYSSKVKERSLSGTISFWVRMSKFAYVLAKSDPILPRYVFTSGSVLCDPLTPLSLVTREAIFH